MRAIRVVPILAILFLTGGGCTKASKLDFPQVQKYSVTPGDVFYFRPGDGQFVLVERRKALAVAIAPGADVQAYAFEDRVTVSRRRPRQGGEFIGAGATDVEMREMTELTKVPMHVTVLAISSDGVKLAGGTAEGVVVVWDLSAGEQVSQVTLRGAVRALAFSPDGKNLAAGLERPAGGGSDAVQILDPATGLMLYSFGTESVMALVWSKNGAQVIAGTAEGSLTFWENGVAAPGIPLSTSSVVALAVHPSGQYLACAHSDKRVTLLQSATGKTWFTFEPALPAGGEARPEGRPADPLFPRGIEQVDFDPAGARLAVSYSDGDQRIWNTSSLK